MLRTVSTAGTLKLSKDVLGVPRDLAEYVVCHELLDLRLPNHAKGFKAMLRAYVPDWEERERRLAGWVVSA